MRCLSVIGEFAERCNGCGGGTLEVQVAVEGAGGGNEGGIGVGYYEGGNVFEFR